MRQGFVGRPRYSATVILVEEPIFSLTERSKTVPSNFFIFVDILEVGHYEFIPQGQTVNHRYYIGTLQHLPENVW
jgi:hypothetical protein